MVGLMPTPNKDETEDDFVSRCIPIVLEEGTAKKPDQAAAICHSMFESHGKESKARKRFPKTYK